jgi:copper homeostasis protein (lipoprotein)
MKLNYTLFAATILICLSAACSNSDKKGTTGVVYKGVYKLGPQEKSFNDCETGNEFWADDKASLEQEYAKLNFEKPYEPVYVEVEGDKIKATKADALDAQYDSIIVVKKLVKITKVIPQDMCN